MRNPSLQHQMRMREIADALTNCSGITQESFHKIRDLEEKAQQLHLGIARQRERKEELLSLQSQLIECQIWTEFGLPPDLDKEKFENIIGKKVD